MPVGIGAGVMGLGYWCFAANVFLTVFQARLVRVPKPSGHLWKFLVTGAAGLTVGTVQGVIQVQPRKPTGCTAPAMRANGSIRSATRTSISSPGSRCSSPGALFPLAAALGGSASRGVCANTCFWSLLGGSLAFYGVALYLGFHEGRLVVGRGLTPEQAEEATPLHPFLIMGAGIAMLAAFWLLLVTRSCAPSAGRGTRCARSSSPAAGRSRSGRCRGRSRRSRRSTSCSTAAATRAT